eukprot:3880293-Rhodomonas_salina.3
MATPRLVTAAYRTALSVPTKPPTLTPAHLPFSLPIPCAAHSTHTLPVLHLFLPALGACLRHTRSR